MRWSNPKAVTFATRFASHGHQMYLAGQKSAISFVSCAGTDHGLSLRTWIFTMRIIFRLIEFSAGQGTNNPLPYTERYFYILDGSPMWLAMFVWNVAHPGRYMRGPDSRLPRLWLSRHLCCGRKRRHVMNPYEHLCIPSAEDVTELGPLKMNRGQSGRF